MAKHIHTHVGGKTKDSTPALEAIDRKLLEAVALCDKIIKGNQSTSATEFETARTVMGQIQAVRNSF